MSGHVYAVYSAEKGLVKIGHTNQLKARLDALRYEEKSSHPLDVLGTCEINQASLVERALHWRFREKREIGEWFRLDQSDIAELFCESRLYDLVNEFLDDVAGVQDTALDHRAIGMRVARYRESYAGVGMSRRQLARRVGLHPFTIGSYEQGRGMSLDAAYRIARVFGITIRDLLGEDEGIS